ncbi:hypothetical protein NMG60_11030247 [Bertholletia excelsa]
MRLFPLRSNSSKEQSKAGSNRALLYLNVYDLTTVNSYLYWFGVGIFHSGIEVHGSEYGFGAHEYATSGVFEVEPRSCPGFIFRRSVLLGGIDMSRSEFRSFMEHLSQNYHGDTYHLIAKNCNHFTDEVCMRLMGKRIPGWVNRLARLGSFCNCLLPESIHVSAVRHLPDHASYSDDGSDSAVSSLTDGSEEEELDHLLTAPNEATLTSCPSVRCSHGSPVIQFPFLVLHLQPKNCVNHGFNLVCSESKTIIQLPSYVDLLVQSISYDIRRMSLLDSKNCVQGVFVTPNLSLPQFHYHSLVKNYTYLDCSARLSPSFKQVPCLSSSDHHIYVVGTSQAFCQLLAKL